MPLKGLTGSGDAARQRCGRHPTDSRVARRPRHCTSAAEMYVAPNVTGARDICGREASTWSVVMRRGGVRLQMPTSEAHVSAQQHA